jgi:hypothetical protein
VYGMKDKYELNMYINWGNNEIQKLTVRKWTKWSINHRW